MMARSDKVLLMPGMRYRRSKAELGPAPSRAVLHEAALAYLARGAATAATLGRVLERRVAGWARKAAREGHAEEALTADVAGCRDAIQAIVARFREVGLIDDAAYARARARSLTGAGRSRRAIAVHLKAKGVDPELVREALPEDAGAELAAALVFARKRRLGPYARVAAVDVRERQKELAKMARAGFGFHTCERALRMNREEADERITASRLRD